MKKEKEATTKGRERTETGKNEIEPPHESKTHSIKKKQGRKGKKRGMIEA